MRTLLYILAVLLLGTTISSAKEPAWRPVGQGDWTGSDWGCSRGATPDPARCSADRRGTVAVCWQNRRVPDGQCPNMDAWCTYKEVAPSSPHNGGNTGTVYACGSDAPVFIICGQATATRCGVDAGLVCKTAPHRVEGGFTSRKAACNAIRNGANETIKELCLDNRPLFGCP